MTTELTFSTIAVLVGLTAIGYAVATAGMKLSTGAPTGLGLALVVGGLLLAVIAEITLLRGNNLAIVYLAIIAVESLLVLCFAIAIGETLNMQQIAGAGLLLGGVALVSH